MIDSYTTTETLQAEVNGRTWFLNRPGDLEQLWEAMDDDEFGFDERIPYWVELWPASLLLANWLDKSSDIAGEWCLDVGCGLGLTACVAAAKGARVVGMDYELPALRFAAGNARQNNIATLRLLLMDWREAGFRPGCFSYVWAGDVLYESRAFEPLADLFDHVLAPGGVVWITEPVRDVSLPAWTDFEKRGWSVGLVTRKRVDYRGCSMRVNLRELRRAR